MRTVRHQLTRARARRRGAPGFRDLDDAGRRAPLRAALLAGLLLAACGGAESEPPPARNLVLIVLDTTRPDWSSAYGGGHPTTPFLAEFARAGTRYERAYSSSSWTLPAHATLFTGLPPEGHRATQTTEQVDPDVPLLGEALARAGFQTAGISNNAWVGARSGLSRGVESWVHPPKVKFPWLRGEIDPDDPVLARTPSVAAVESWLATERDPERPFFLFVNLMEPHEPYAAPLCVAEPFLPVASDARLKVEIARLYPQWAADPIVRRHYDQGLSDPEWTTLRGLYRAGLRYVDDVARQIVELVDAASPADETLIVIASDHGENLGDHGHIGHMFNLYDSNLRVVLVARGPGFERGEVVSTPVHLADVHATLLAAAGAERPPNSFGVDLRRDAPGDRVFTAFLDTPLLSLRRLRTPAGDALARPFERQLWAAVGPRYKLIAGSDGSEELYDLSRDPDEQRPLAPADVPSGALADLRSALDGARAAQAAAEPMTPPPMDEETRQALGALGYVK